MEKLLEKIAQELSAQNKLIAMRIAKENLDCCKFREELIEDMKRSTERIIKWAYSYPTDSFPLDLPEMQDVIIKPSDTNLSK